MKKFLFTIALLTMVTATNAQFVASLQMNGSKLTLGSNTSSLYIGRSMLTGNDTTYTYADTAKIPTTMGASVGLKFGYQFSKLQIGISGSFAWSQEIGEESILDFATVHNDHEMAVYNQDYDQYTSQYEEQLTSYTIAPYLRYELIQFGDVAFFAELTAYYSVVNQPKRHDFLDWYRYDMHYTIDTTFSITKSSVSLGAKLTPGLSWQLSHHCSIDLYLDVLSLVYDYTTVDELTVIKEFDYTASPRILERTINTSSTTTSTEMGFGVTGSPLLSSRNWMRVGFNYTF